MQYADMLRILITRGEFLRKLVIEVLYNNIFYSRTQNLTFSKMKTLYISRLKMFKDLKFYKTYTSP